MENNQSSQIVSNKETQDEIISGNPSEQVLETQPVSVINTQNNNALQLKKWIIAGGVVVLTIAVCIFLAKETDVCFMSTCNHYSDSTGSDSTSIGNDFIAYAGGAATLLVLTTLVGIPLLPAVAISTGVWFVLQMIR
jgi:hypothetical protein